MFAMPFKKKTMGYAVGGKLHLLYNMGTPHLGLRTGFLKILGHSFRATERKLGTKCKRLIPMAVT